MWDVCVCCRVGVVEIPATILFCKLYAIIKCIQLNISEMYDKLQFPKKQIDFNPLMFLGSNYVSIAQVLYYHSLENQASIF